jgi:hypothetical protein
MIKFQNRRSKVNRFNMRRTVGLKTFVCLVFLAAFTLPQSAQAWIDLSVTPLYGESNDTVHAGGGNFPGEGAVSTTTKTGYDLRTTLGFVLLNHILIGGSLNTSASTASRPGLGATDTEKNVKESRMEYGPTLGLVYDGFHFSFTYLMAGKRTQNILLKDTAGAVTYNGDLTDKDGVGYQAKIGYAFHVTQSFLLGPTLVYRQVTYSKQDYKNNIGSGSYDDKAYETKPVEGSLTPFLSAVLSF